MGEKSARIRKITEKKNKKRTQKRNKADDDYDKI